MHWSPSSTRSQLHTSVRIPLPFLFHYFIMQKSSGHTEIYRRVIEIYIDKIPVSTPTIGVLYIPNTGGFSALQSNEAESLTVSLDIPTS